MAPAMKSGGRSKPWYAFDCTFRSNSPTSSLSGTIAVRMDFTGFSVLPPGGRFKPWSLVRWREQETEGVTLLSERIGDRASFLYALVATVPLPDREWRQLGATPPTVSQRRYGWSHLVPVPMWRSAPTILFVCGIVRYPRGPTSR